MLLSLKNQPEHTRHLLNEHIYKLSERFYSLGFSADRFDQITDFTRNIAIVPISARYGDGIAELLLVLIGLSQKYLENELQIEDGSAEGTVLEVKELRGHGTTLDVLLYKGTISKGDTIILGGKTGIIKSHVKALLKPSPLDEIRDPEHRFQSVESVSAAAGIKIAGPGLDDALAGTVLKVVKDEAQLETLITELNKELTIEIETTPEGVILKADAIGSLEALAYECKQFKIPIRKYSVGNVSKNDIMESQTNTKPEHRVVLAFNTKLLPECRDLLKNLDVKIFESNIVYRLIEEYNQWVYTKKVETDTQLRSELVYPAKVRVLHGYIFRLSNPAIFGVRVLSGNIRPGISLMTADGKSIGRIKSIQKEKESLKEAFQGAEIAISVEDAVIGKNVNVEDELFTDIPEEHARKLLSIELTFDEKECFNKIIEIKRKIKPSWGM